MSDDFKREDSHKKKSVPASWKRPTGTHSRIRLEKKSAAPKPKAGYRTDREARGKHPSGYEEVLVHNPQDVEQVNEGEAARIASSVGAKKREQIEDRAAEEGVKILNPGEKDE